MDLKSKTVTADDIWLYVTSNLNDVIDAFEKAKDGEDLTYEIRSKLQNILNTADEIEMVNLDISSYEVAHDWFGLKRIARNDRDVNENNYEDCMKDLAKLFNHFKLSIPGFLLNKIKIRGNDMLAELERRRNESNEYESQEEDEDEVA